MLKRIHIIFALICLTSCYSLVYSQNETYEDSIGLRINRILTDYTNYISAINKNSSRAEKKALTDLFHNDYVQVFKDIDLNDKKDAFLTIRDYIDSVATMFPDLDDIKVTINLNTLDIRKPKRNNKPPRNRYLIDVYLDKNIEGIHNNDVFSRDVQLIFTFEYNLVNELPEDLCIYRISKAKEYDIRLGLNISLESSNIKNPNVFNDNRFNNSNSMQFNPGVELTWYFNERFGIGSGIKLSRYKNNIELDHFDALGEYDPNFININMTNTLQYLEVPILLKIKSAESHKTALYFSGGLQFDILLGNSFSSSAINKHTYVKRENVLSDIAWKNNLKNTFISGYLEAGIYIPVSKNIIIKFGGHYLQGLMQLENYSISTYNSDKYKGRYNVLYSEPDANTIIQSFGFEIGISYIL